MKKTLCLICSFIFAGMLFAENIGLVLSGGGAKGAYEVGVWKAMNEYGLNYDTRVISGSSIGALNGALFACTDEKSAEKLWKEQIAYSSSLIPQSGSFTDAIKFSIRSAENKKGIREQNENPYNLDEDMDDDTKDFLTGLFDNVVFLADVTTGIGKNTSKLISDYIFSIKHTKGLYDHDELQQMISENVSLSGLKHSGIEVYATAVAKNGDILKNAFAKFFDADNVHYFDLNEQTSDESVVNVLLASSAFPLIYDSVLLNEDIIENGSPIEENGEYIDGGFEAAGGKNTPVEPAVYSSSVDKLIIVYLSSVEEMEDNTYSDTVTRAELKGKAAIEIIPSENLGTLVDGTTNYDSEKINSLIDLGYNDACAVFEANGYKKMGKIKRFFKRFF